MFALREGAGLGLDIGRVIRDKLPTNGVVPVTFEDFLRARPPVPGAFEAIRILVERAFGDRVWLVSLCTTQSREWSEAWLRHHGFFERTGVRPENVRYCSYATQKGEICRGLGVSCLVDNKWSLLEHAWGVRQLLLFDPSYDELWRFAQVTDAMRDRTVLVRNWQEALTSILGLEAPTLALS